MQKFLAFVCLLLIGCEDNINTFQLDAELNKSSQSFNKGWIGKEFKLKVGEEIVLHKENLKIKFLSVPEDSRCPINVDCVWSGNAKVVLTYQKNSNQAVNDTLNTHLQPNGSRYLKYRIILKDLEPYPIEAEPIPTGEYIATILVKKTTNNVKYLRSGE